jgi:type IV secretory pathway TraG/TraD family ATPase VirD4
LWPTKHTTLLLPHEVLQLDAEHVIACAGGVPPAQLEHIDWRIDRNSVSSPTSQRRPFQSSPPHRWPIGSRRCST